MTAPLHERLAEAAKAAEQSEWIGKPREDAEDAVYISTPIGPDVQFKHVAIAVHPHHIKRAETTAFLITAQPANVAKLCEQVRVMKEALEKIEAIKDQIDGGDWDEIAKARGIAHLAMLVIRESE